MFINYQLPTLSACTININSSNTTFKQVAEGIQQGFIKLYFAKRKITCLSTLMESFLFSTEPVA